MRTTFDRLLFGTVTDRAQRLRLHRFYMAQLSYGLWYAVVWAGWFGDLVWVEASTLALAGLGVMATQGVFLVLLRTGLNLRFREPSLTFAQILVGISWGMVLIAFSHEMRGLVLAAVMIAMLFGVFALSRRRFIALAAFAAVAYMTVSLIERSFFPEPLSDAFYLASSVMLVAVLFWTAWFGSYVSNLRHRLQERNESLRVLLEENRRLAERDELTGLHNRRFVLQALEALAARTLRDGVAFSLCIIDLDHFKSVNDRLGHNAGDAMLVRFARVIEDELRDMDFVARNTELDRTFARYGGEEFILLLPATGLAGALTCAERLRARMEAEFSQTKVRVTLSAGVAEHDGVEHIESLLRRADRALYEAKAAGRNRVRQAA